MNTYVLLEAEVGLGVFEHSIVPVDLNNPKSIHEAVLLFVDDLYSEGGNRTGEISREEYVKWIKKATNTINTISTN